MSSVSVKPRPDDPAVDRAVEGTVELLQPESARQRDQCDADALEALLEDRREHRGPEILHPAVLHRAVGDARDDRLDEARREAAAEGREEGAVEEGERDQPPRLGLEAIAPPDEEHVHHDERGDAHHAQEEACEHVSVF